MSGEQPLACNICTQNEDAKALGDSRVWASRDWLLRHDSDPCPIVGWLILQPRRHVQGISGLSSREANEFGSLSHFIAKSMEQVLQAPKVYQVAFGESVDHMHVHFIPRYYDLDSKYFGFGIADLQREVKSRKQAGRSNELTRLAAGRLRDYFQKFPPNEDE